MDGQRFDDVVRRVVGTGGSRRGVLRALTVGALTVLLGGATSEEAAAACAANGRKCDPAKPEQCCSGRCQKKQGGGGTCKPAPGAKGCTNRQGICDGALFYCPDANDGSFCVVLNNGQPYCAGAAFCSQCEDGRDCDQEFNREGGRCVTRCSACNDSGTNRACVFPPT